MKKPFLLFCFGIALYFNAKRYYQNGQGLPSPNAFTGASYLFGILGVLADSLGGVIYFVTAGLTLAIFWNSQNQKNGAWYVGPSSKPNTNLPAGPGMYSGPPPPGTNTKTTPYSPGKILP